MPSSSKRSNSRTRQRIGATNKRKKRSATSKSKSRSKGRKRSVGSGYRKPSTHNRRRSNAGGAAGASKRSASAASQPNTVHKFENWKDPLFPPQVAHKSTYQQGSADLGFGQNFGRQFGLAVALLILLGIGTTFVYASVANWTTKGDENYNKASDFIQEQGGKLWGMYNKKTS